MATAKHVQRVGLSRPQRCGTVCQSATDHATQPYLSAEPELGQPLRSDHPPPSPGTLSSTREPGMRRAQRALNEEMTEHLGHEKNRAEDGRESECAQRDPAEDGADRGHRARAARGAPRSRWVVRPGDREEAAALRQRRLNGVDEILLSLYAHG
jgi:hypothetical protein